MDGSSQLDKKERRKNEGETGRARLGINTPEGPFILTGVLGVKTAMVTCPTFAPIKLMAFHCCGSRANLRIGPIIIMIPILTVSSSRLNPPSFDAREMVCMKNLLFQT